MTTRAISTSSNRTRFAVAAAGAAVGLCAAFTVDAAQTPEPAERPAPSQALIDFARDHGLTGLSPASLHRFEPDVAGFARANDLTGLSPASVSGLSGTTPGS